MKPENNGYNLLKTDNVCLWINYPNIINLGNYSEFTESYSKTSVLKMPTEFGVHHLVQFPELEVIREEITFIFKILGFGITLELNSRSRYHVT